MLQKAYREEGKKEAGCSLYAQMPQTIETVFAKELTKTLSDVSLASLHSEVQTLNARKTAQGTNFILKLSELSVL